jgi:hypothetical protein
MKTTNLVIYFLIILISASCSSTKILKFAKTQDNIVTTPSLKEFLDKNKNPKVVLRVSDASYTVTEGENIDYLYNAIENQLLASGFKVRDRQLFNQIIGNDDNTIDYEKLKAKSDTDLIIELTKLDPQILYETNKYYTNEGEEKVEKYTKRQRYGASIEFKIVLIESNEFAGIYKFNYTPCVEGCVISKSLKETMKEQKKKKKDGPEGYEGMELNELESFIKEATKQLVAEMRS